MKTVFLCRYSVLFAVVLWAFCSSAAMAETLTNLHLAVPGSNWCLEINSPGFVLEESDFSRDGSEARLEAENKVGGIILSAFLEKAATTGDAKQCRAYYWEQGRQSPMQKDDLKMFEIGPVAALEYIVKEYGGLRVNQKNVNAYLSDHGYWVDVHLSKSGFQPQDETKLQSIARSIRFNDHFVPTTGEWATWGRFFMSKRNYAEAARCDENAWATEQSHPSLSHEQQIYLLSDLIDAHGNLGHITRAKELTEAGLRKEPSYPKFSYDLACCYAEQGDKTRALQNLKTALQNRTQLLKGDQLPNPAEDSSFSKYSSDPDFAGVFMNWNK